MRSSLLSLLLCPICLIADEKPLPATATGKPVADVPAKKRALTMEELKKFYSDEKDRIITEWIDYETSEKVWLSLTKAGYRMVASEGKMEDGEMVFRTSYKHLADYYPGTEEIRRWFFCGVTKDAFEAKVAELEKNHYAKIQMQTFVDGEGKPRYCGIWANPVPAPKKKE